MDLVTQNRFEKRLRRVSKNLNLLLEDIRLYYPEANYMVEGGVISVITASPKGGEIYSEGGSLVSSDFISHLDCGLWE